MTNIYTIPATLDQLEPMSDAIMELFSQHSLAISYADELGMVQLAVHELLVNIMEHSYINQEGTIQVSFTIDKGIFNIELQDSGISFDPPTILEPEADSLQPNGFGMFLIDTIMDTVEYQTALHKNQWRLSKKIV